MLVTLDALDPLVETTVEILEVVRFSIEGFPLLLGEAFLGGGTKNARDAWDVSRRTSWKVSLIRGGVSSLWRFSLLCIFHYYKFIFCLEYL